MVWDPKKLRGERYEVENVNDSGLTPHIQATLKNFFGFSSFKPNQEQIVLNILKGRDVFAAMPTGGGKSLCYQLPALLLPGLTVVISPLIALMKDQVDAARESGIAAAYLNSTLTASEASAVYQGLQTGELKILYISPERFAFNGFSERLKSYPIALFAVDEAHCLSEWGHDFRPDYLLLSGIKKAHPAVPLAAFTATATRRVQSDIISRLKLHQPLTIRASFNRPELLYRVVKKEKAEQQILRFVKEHPGQAGIVYRTTRDAVEKTAAFLAGHGLKALAYHAGLRDETRKRHQDLFNRDEIDVIVATIAFGMGIDKSNIRYVVHGDLPKSIEGYYQETGRAGRDGELAHCLLLFSPGDAVKIKYHIENMTDEAEQQRARGNLQRMISFAAINVCRRKQLLAYFDEEHQGNCGMCDICNDETERIDASVDAQKLMSAILRTGERFGIVHVIDVVWGAATEKIKKFNHTSIKTYGIGRDKSKRYWSSLVDELIGQECVYQDHEHYNALRLTDKGKRILYGKEQLFITRKVEVEKSALEKNLSDYDHNLFEILRALRMELAKEKRLPPFMIFSDKTLHEICVEFPVTSEKLLLISGVGQRKLEEYGERVLKRVKKYLAEKSVPGSEGV